MIVEMLTASEEHKRSKYDTIDLGRDAVVNIIQEDDEYPGWLLCETTSGPGYIPSAFMRVEGRQGTLLRDYTTCELTTVRGEQLRELERHRGWVFCEKRSGERGWVPERTVITSTGRQ